MKNFLFVLMIIWAILGTSAANDRGFFDKEDYGNCTFVGSGLLTIVAGPINYAGVHPRAAC